MIGLIGEGGAIGVFHGAVGVGGFQAGPPPPRPCETAGNCVDHTLWLANARDATNAAALVIPATAMTQAYSFVQAGATDLNLTNSNAADNRVVKLSDISGNDNDTSGFALGSIGQAGDTRRYVGILNGTDVGSPLTLDASITGEWKGFLAMQTANFSSAKAITLDVGFDGTVGTIATKSGGFAATVNGTSAPNITINGKFGANGVIYGTTSVTNVDTSSSAFGTGAIAGTLTGLIGEDGAVGVFSGANVHDVSFGYVGGFVAEPFVPDPWLVRSSMKLTIPCWARVFWAGLRLSLIRARPLPRNCR